MANSFLGKTSVVAKDTPAFIGNRVGIFSIQSLFHAVKDLDLPLKKLINYLVQSLVAQNRLPLERSMLLAWIP